MHRIILSAILCSVIGLSLVAQENSEFRKTGVYFGMNFGTWFPDNSNRVLGNPVIFGFTLDLRGPRNSCGFTADGLLQGQTMKPVMIKFGDSVLIRNEYSGAQFTLDYYRQLLEFKHFVFEGLFGLGFGTISYYNPDKYTNIDKSSLILSPGFSIRFIVDQSFIQIKAQYCIADYRLKDGISTDFKGNYLLTKIVVGGWSN